MFLIGTCFEIEKNHRCAFPEIIEHYEKESETMNKIFYDVPTLKRLFKGLHFVHYMSKPYGKTTRICFCYEIPNKIVDAKGANVVEMYITHFREKIDLYRRKVPRRNENAVHVP